MKILTVGGRCAMNNDLYNDNIYVVEKDDSYFIINIDSLNIIALSKKACTKMGN